MNRARAIRAAFAVILMVSTVSAVSGQAGDPLRFGRAWVEYSYGPQGLQGITTAVVPDPVWRDLKNPVVFVNDGNGEWSPRPVGLLYEPGGIQVVRLDGGTMVTSTYYDVVAIDGAAVPNAFIHEATPAGIYENWTLLESLETEFNPDAVIIVTPHAGPDSNHPIGVWYTGSQWSIYNADLAPMASGRRFSVLVLDPADPSPVSDLFAVETRRLAPEMQPAGSQVHETRLPYRDGQMRIFATTNYRQSGPDNSSPLSVRFDNRSWILENSTMNDIPPNLMVNLVVFKPSEARNVTSGFRDSGHFYPPYRFVAGPAMGLRSVRSAIPVTVTLTQQLGDAVVYWIDYAGNPVEYFRLSARETLTFQTFETHVWVIDVVQGDYHTYVAFIADERPEQEVTVYVEK